MQMTTSPSRKTDQPPGTRRNAKEKHTRTVIVVSLMCVLSAAAFAQVPAPANIFPPQTIDEMKRIQQAALASDYAWKQLAHLTDNIGPRLAGSAQAQQAVEYVAAEMRKLGLEVQLEKCTVPRWVRGEEKAALIEFPGQAPNTTQKIVLTALGGSVATPESGVTAEVVVVRNFDELNALGRDKVQGKIVLFNVKYDKQMAAIGFGLNAYGEVTQYRWAGASAAARLGAVAVLVRSAGGGERLPHTGAMGYAKDVPKIPAAAVTSEDADLLDYLALQGHVRMQLVLTPHELPETPSYNVIGDLKGSEHPEQVVIVSGHLDSWDLGTGAIDDGAGVAAAMDAVRIIKGLGLRPKRTLRVIAWMNEEFGLSGGDQYAKDHAGDLANQFAAIESDLGADHPVGFYVGNQQELVGLLRPVSRVLLSSGAGIVTTGGGGVDISPLTARGVPSFSPIQDVRTYFDYHHTAADTLDKVNPQFLRENTAIMAVLGYALTNIPQDLPRPAPQRQPAE